MFPDLAVVVYTYDRPDYAERTIRSALANLSYSGVVHVHVADDGSPEVQVERLVAAAAEEAEGRPYGFGEITSTNAARSGYGASYNLATQVAHGRARVFLCLEDDWELRRTLDLDPLVAALGADAGIGCIRLGYVGWTEPLVGRFVHAAGLAFLLLDPESPERHVFAGHPRLETFAFERNVGPWPEGLDAGSTEFAVAGRPTARQGVAWPLDIGLSATPRADLSLFAHIGAVQARADQRPAGNGPEKRLDA